MLLEKAIEELRQTDDMETDTWPSIPRDKAIDIVI